MQLTDAVFIPLIMALVELAKRLGFPTKYSPIMAVAFGVLAGIFYLDVSVKMGIILGLIMGLSASGLYSGAKNIAQTDSFAALLNLIKKG